MKNRTQYKKGGGSFPQVTMAMTLQCFKLINMNPFINIMVYYIVREENI